jgi:hypothetical protein
MRRLLLSLFALFISFSLPINDAEAKRFGGGKSSGMQRQAPMKRDAAQQPQSPRRPERPPPRRASAPGWAPSPAWPPVWGSPRCFRTWGWAKRWPIS